MQVPVSAVMSMSSSGQPDAMAQRHARAEQAEVVEMPHGGLAGAAHRVFLLVRRLQQVHVHRHIGRLGLLVQRQQAVVGTPVQVGRRKLDAGQALAPVLLRQLVEQGQEVGEWHGLRLQVGQQLGTERLRQLLAELLIRLVDQPVLLPDGVAVGRPHAEVAVGVQHLAGGAVDSAVAAGHPAVDVLDGGDARRDHLEGGIERVEVQVDLARRHPSGEPKLQRIIGRAELRAGSTRHGGGC